MNKALQYFIRSASEKQVLGTQNVKLKGQSNPMKNPGEVNKIDEKAIVKVIDNHPTKSTDTEPAGKKLSYKHVDPLILAQEPGITF